MTSKGEHAGAPHIQRAMAVGRINSRQSSLQVLQLYILLYHDIMKIIRV